jgi:hypothetical protein
MRSLHNKRMPWGRGQGPNDRAEISGISPFFIVSDAPSALSFYRDQLGFDITFQEPADDPFFGII